MKSVTEKAVGVSVTPGVIHGYARCSTSEARQDINRQIRELKEAGASVIWHEFEHGDTEAKEQQDLMFETVKAGDTIIITEPSRLSRSVQQFCAIVGLIQVKHIRLQIIGSTALSKYANEAQAEFFLEEIKKVCRTATVILYTGGTPSRGVLSVVEKLKAAVRNVSIIHLDTYTPDELTRIAERLLDEYGVSVDISDEFHNALREVVTLEACQTVKDTVAVTERAVKMADFSGYMPTLSIKQLKSAFSDVFDREKGEGR